MEENSTNVLWRFTSTKENLPKLLQELHDKSIIFPFELDQLQTHISAMTADPGNNSPSFISGLNKDVIFLPSIQDNDSFDILIDRNIEKLDLITHLPSKFALQQQIDQWQKKSNSEQIIALFLIELDEFSKVNDVLDHAAGDIVLYQAARRLENLPDFNSKVVRLHGDEFAIAVTGLGSLEQVWQISSWIENQFEEPFIYNHIPVYITPSIGISAIPHVANEHTELLRTAYLALNKAKMDVTQVAQLYEAKHAEDLKKELAIRSELSSELRHGNGIEVFYQPKQSLHNDKIEGVEALVRWRHKSRGLISPGEFIPIAEESKLICQLTDYVVHQVCKDIKELKNWGYQHQVSINISARDFARKDFVTDICAIVKEHNVHPNDIELEITEGAFISDFSHCCVVLNALRDFGFSISIDDFGTGYSSLSYLRKLPIDVLKIDMSFVREIESSDTIRRIYGALIEIANALNLKVVAEGVENENQRLTLKKIDCDLIQGYLLSKPLPLKAFCEQILASEPPE
jgi:diguanylate cyclase (GGDEF)-like protein